MPRSSLPEFRMPHPALRPLVAALALCALGPALSQQAAVPTYGPLPEPVPVVGAKPMSLPSFEALKGDGLYYFNGANVGNLRLDGKQAGDRHALMESSTDASGSAFNGNIDVAHFVRDGERKAVGRPSFATPAQDGTVTLTYAGQTPLHLKVRLQAYDVSGLHVREFLRTSENFPRPEATRAGSATFPAGSIAYLATVRFAEDTLMLPKRESFTGAKNTGEFVHNFSRQIPFCLSYEDRNGAKPYAMLFKTTGGKKGPLILYGAKPGTLFCDRDGPQVVAEGEWEERTVGGTKAVVLSFATNVDPLDTGVTHVERESARIAFIEPTKGTMGVRPGKLYLAGQRVNDFQYRFNKTAADAIRGAVGGQ
jgi:hypothetical protein